MDPVAPTPGPRRFLIPVLTIVLLGLLAAGLVVWNMGRTSAAVALEPASEAGPDPFLDAADTSTPAAFTDTVTATVVEAATSRASDPSTGTLAAPGDTAGLYAALPEAPACDVAALSAGITADPATAAAWAQVRGITPEQIPDHLGALFPVHLTVDTLVTNHRFQDGAAVPFAAVLQAGTSVLVDARGTPAVRCACGNPLLPPDPVGLGNATFTGNRWVGFDQARRPHGGRGVGRTGGPLGAARPHRGDCGSPGAGRCPGGAGPGLPCCLPGGRHAGPHRWGAQTRCDPPQ